MCGIQRELKTKKCRIIVFTSKFMKRNIYIYICDESVNDNYILRTFYIGCENRRKILSIKVLY